MSTTYVLLGLVIQFVINEFIKNLTEKKFRQVITKKKYYFHENVCVFGVLLSINFSYSLTFLCP